MNRASFVVFSAFKELLNLETRDIPLIGIDIPIPTFPESLITKLCQQTIQVLSSLPCYANTYGPLYVVGDIHANIFDLLRIFIYSKPPPESKFLFLGDYVDRGEFSVEVVCLLFALLCEFPDNIILLRGNHEFQQTNRNYGFFDEVRIQFESQNIYNSINEAFSYLQIWALINDTIFAVHGGLSPSLTSLDQIKSIERPITSLDSGLLSDLVWSDPSLDVDDFLQSVRGLGVNFGPNVIKTFLENNGLTLIIRGHQCVRSGISKFDKGSLYTIFSCSNYEGRAHNRAGLLYVQEDSSTNFFSLPPISTLMREGAALKFVSRIANQRVESTSAIPIGMLSRSVTVQEQSYIFNSQRNIRPRKRNGAYQVCGQQSTGSLPCLRKPSD